MKKKLLIISGYISLFLGITGIFVPLLPTTPFLLLTATCFMHSSDTLYHWVTHHKVFGKYIKGYQRFKAISLRAKIVTILLLLICIGYSVFILNSLLLRIVLFVIAICVSIHILRLRTLTKEMVEQLK